MRKTPNELLFESASPDKVMPIYFLWRAIWRFVFDENNCPMTHRSDIEREIIKWNDIVQYQKRIRHEKYGPTESDKEPVGKKGNIIDELEYQIGMMCKTLVENEEGYWKYHKDTLRVHQIDYKKSIHCNEWFPEVQDKDRFKRGQANLKKAMEGNPEDYREEKPNANPIG